MRSVLTIPNALTLLRIVGAVVLIFLPPGIAFFVVYSLCGISDGLDGFIARAIGCESEFGAKLDSVADLMLYSVMLAKLLPTLFLLLPGWIWYAVAAIIAVRIASYLTAALRFRRFASLHTKLNKLTGLVLFAVPYLLGTAIITPYCIAVTVTAAAASLEELFIHLTSPKSGSAL